MASCWPEDGIAWQTDMISQDKAWGRAQAAQNIGSTLRIVVRRGAYSEAFSCLFWRLRLIWLILRSISNKSISMESFKNNLNLKPNFHLQRNIISANTLRTIIRSELQRKYASLFVLLQFQRMTIIEMKPPPVKNKEAALVQITADQILKDAEIHRPIALRPPMQRIMDEKQLHVYKQEKRREFEDKLRRQRYNLSVWVRYAQWEENLKEYARSRSVFERALEIEYTNKSLWLKYVEMEMKNKFVNHARNVWERAIYYLPREDQFWFKYAYMEELLGEYVKARDVFERWMEWTPGEKAWMAFIKFEERMGEPIRAKALLYRFLEVHASLPAYLKVAKFQQRNRNKEAARAIYERAITELGNEALDEGYFIDFSQFEKKQRQFDRAREIFKFGLRHLPKNKSLKLYQLYLNFEKEHGSQQQIDEVILGERREVYRKLIAENELNYDAWLNLLALQESAGQIEKTREAYESAVTHIPPAQQKRFWRRYMYIWYHYALFEEEIAKDLQRAEAVYERALKIVPHKIFTFGKLWIFYAHFCLRCNDLDKARKILGRAIGLCPKKKTFKAYIELEEKLCQLDRVRMIYEKYCKKFLSLPQPWIEYASFELNLQELERARQILSISQQLRVDGVPEFEELLAQLQAEEGDEGSGEDNQ